jgi:hypothetical protein
VVTGWSITLRNKDIVYDIQFKRLASEASMDMVLRRPFSDEIEDYREYKRIRDVMRSAQKDGTKVKRETAPPTVTFSTDGAFDDLVDVFSNVDLRDSVMRSSWCI